MMKHRDVKEMEKQSKSYRRLAIMSYSTLIYICICITYIIWGLIVFETVFAATIILILAIPKTALGKKISRFLLK
jgi:hypothetical protein